MSARPRRGPAPQELLGAPAALAPLAAPPAAVPEPGVWAELRHLRCFVAVAEELNFTRAGDRLHIAQQAVSATIRQLEQHLDVALFVRDSRHVELTAAGAALLEDARSILRFCDQAWSRARRARLAEHTARLAYADDVRYGALPALHRTLRTRAPGVHVQAVAADALELGAAVAQGLADVALTREVLPVAGVRADPVFAEPLVALADPGHPLARAGEVGAADLDDVLLVLPDPRGAPAQRAAAEAACRQAGALPQVLSRPLDLSDTWSVAEHAAGGAIALVPASVADGLAHLGLRRLALPGAPSAAPVLLLRRSHDRAPAAELVARVLQQDAAGRGVLAA